MNIYVISGGHRNRLEPSMLLSLIYESSDIDNLANKLKFLAKNDELSNSDIGVACASYGASSEGAIINLVRLNQVINVEGRVNNDGFETVDKIIEDGDGIIIGSPLHFGNSSSYVMRFMELLSQQKQLALLDKVVGFSLVGARRNGGQEAGNIFGLLESSQLGACVVGDGPPFSQSGGILESRRPLDGLNDIEGIKSNFNIGRRVVRARKIINPSGTPPNSENTNYKITIIVDSNKTELLAREQITSYVAKQGISCEVLNLEKYKVERCIGCSECPVSTEHFYKCIIDDDMKEIERLMVNADGFIVFLEAKSCLWSSYYWQTFVERLRYLRRGDYKLANKPVWSMQLCSDSFSSPFHVRILPPVFKHDMIFVGPSLNIYHEENFQNDTTRSILYRYCQVVKRSNYGRLTTPYYSAYKEEAKRFV